MEIMVTVYCLAFNHEKYIRDALEGFVCQKTNFSYEVIVHDDASNDNTPQIIREYAEKYPDIVKPIFQTENQYSKGVSILNAFMLPAMKGKYIALCEGDDYWTDDYKLQKQFDIMEKHPECSLVTHWSKMLREATGELEDYAIYDKRIKNEYVLETADIIRRHLLFSTNSMFFRREHYNLNQEISTKVKRFDYVTKTLLATEGTVYVIPQIMSVYRFGSDGSWTMRVKENAPKMIAHLEESIRYFNLLNEYRNYQYDAVIKEVIHQREFDILIQKRDLKGIKSSDYFDLYEKFTFAQKALLYFKIYFPHMYDKLKYKLKPRKRIIMKKAKR